MFNLNDKINSPQLVRNGAGAWTGTLAEAISWETDRWETVANHMIPAGRLDQSELDADDFDLANHVDAMTIEDIRNLLDDPDATVERVEKIQLEWSPIKTELVDHAPDRANPFLQRRTKDEEEMDVAQLGLLDEDDYPTDSITITNPDPDSSDAWDKAEDRLLSRHGLTREDVEIVKNS